MKLSSRLCSAVLSLALLAEIAAADKMLERMLSARTRQQAHQEKFKRMHNVDTTSVVQEPGLIKRQDGSPITFSNPAAQKFFVNGSTIPDGKRLVLWIPLIWFSLWADEAVNI